MRIVKLIALLSALMLALAGCGEKTTAATEAAAQESAAGLTIPLDTLTEQPLFVDWEQDGTAMQLIALVDASGAPQLAYNTCQVCAGSPYAYFEYQNGALVCQNCGNRFELSSVGKASGGCNPMPVTDYASDGTQLIVPEEALAQAAASFKNWKAFK